MSAEETRQDARRTRKPIVPINPDYSADNPERHTELALTRRDHA
jgi:hypothetical protein